VRQLDGSEWTSLTERVDSGAWAAVWVDDLDRAWIVGDDGLVLRVTADAVETLESGVISPLGGVHGTDNDVWVAGYGPDGPILLHDSGQGFEQVAAEYPMGATGCALIWSAAEATWIAGADWLGVWDGSSLATRVVLHQDLQAIWGASAHDVWTISDWGYVTRYLETTEESFQIDGLDEYRLDIGGSSADDVWVSHLRGGVFRGAGAFTPMPLPGVEGPALWVANHDEAYVVGNDGLARWDGSTWTRPRGIKPELVDVAGNVSGVWAIGPHATILHRKR
jgi:hypothetical protein